MPDPEALARVDIDHLLDEAGWRVQDRDKINFFAGNGVAIREAYIPGVGEAYYFLAAEQHAVGIVGEIIKRRMFVIEQMEATVEAILKRPESLLQSILRQAFSGRLVTSMEEVTV